jgi:UDP-N-acetylmuramoyl-tripeptide--D-alanyl-D-alanine ligase
VAVLGDMYELGAETEEGHRQTGAKAASVGIGLLVAVGELGRMVGAGAVAAGLSPEQTLFAANNDEAIALLQERLQPGDTVLVKGSRGMQMEHIVAALCPDPDAGG